MTDDSKIITSIRQTCMACPSQWEFKTKDNRTGYIRYRWGVLKIQLSEENGSLNDALDSELILHATFGDDHDGTLSEKQMVAALILVGLYVEDKCS